MSELLRTDTIFGKRANIVGDISADLVLESLGKVYIKSRNSAKTLEEVIKSIVFGDVESSGSKAIIVEGLEQLDLTTIKPGQFVYDKLSNILYLQLEDELIELINVAPEGTGYVKRSGDTMTGRLTINVPYGAPLHVNSTELVKNLNANYLQGYSADSFARKAKDEIITGKWTFRAPTKFEKNVKMGQDLIVEGSVGTPAFASGFGGYGWRMDADTNTLTVDNLVVRKLMRVYELVVNRISATNGSLWVTNAGKVTKAQKLLVYTKDIITTGKIELDSDLHALLQATGNNGYFAMFPAANENTVSTYSGNDLINASGNSMLSITTFNSEARAQAYVVRLTGEADIVTYHSQENDITYYQLTTTFSDQEESDVYRTYKLYADDFNFDVVLPVIPRNYYNSFKISEEYRRKYQDAVRNVDDGISDLYATYTAQAQTEVRTTGGPWPRSGSGFLEPSDVIANMKSYYKYFATGDFYVVKFDDDELPVFKPGDILRCQKWTYGGIKYYDAVVCNYIDTSTYIIQVADSVLDQSTRITYNDNLEPELTYGEDVQNTVLYQRSTRKSIDGSIKGDVEEKDSLVQMGNLWDTQRQNAVYITSTDDAAPYIDVLSGLNRPDFSVLYYLPTYETLKLYKRNKYLNIGCNNDDVPYTGEYYVQNSATDAEFAAGKYYYNGTEYNLFIDLSKNRTHVSKLTTITYLASAPNSNTKFFGNTSYASLTTEADQDFITEDSESTLVREEEIHNMTANSINTTKVRIGKLDGIIDNHFEDDKQPYGYGLYASNAFLVGEFYLSNGRSLAEISEEAITFAAAVRDGATASIDILRNDTKAIENRLDIAVKKLKNNVYTRNQLLSAGITIKENVLGLWGGAIYMFTTYDELYGWSNPTALFEQGRIKAKFLSVDEAHSNVAIQVPPTSFTINGVYYESNDPTTIVEGKNGTVRTFRPKVLRDSENLYFDDGNTMMYVRRFLSEGQLIWLEVTPEGYPITDGNGNYILNYPAFYLYTDSSTPEVYDQGIIPGEAEDYFVNQYTDPLKLWGLEIDGKGNLGGHTLYWNAAGKVVVDGTIFADQGRIGGFNLTSNSLYTRDGTYSPIYIKSATTYAELPNDYMKSWLSSNTGSQLIKQQPYIQVTNRDSTGEFTALLTSHGLYYKKDRGVMTQAPTIAFSLTIIPFWSNVTHDWTLLARLNGNEVFQTAYVVWDNGIYIISFPGLDSSSSASDWYTRAVMDGELTFQVTGHAAGRTNVDYQGNSQYGSGSSTSFKKNYYMFNYCLMRDNPNYSYQMQYHSDNGLVDIIKASLDQICCTNENGLNFNTATMNDNSSPLNTRLKYGSIIVKNLTGFGGYQGSGISKFGLSSNMFNNTTGIGTFKNNALIISTSNDSRKWGGFTLTAIYSPKLQDGELGGTVDDNIYVGDNYAQDTQAAYELAQQIRSTYDINGTSGRYYALQSALSLKLAQMTSEQAEDQSSDVAMINENIQYIYDTVSDVSDSDTLGNLQNIQAALNSCYENTSDAIDGLEAGQTSDPGDDPGNDDPPVNDHGLGSYITAWDSVLGSEQIRDDHPAWDFLVYALTRFDDVVTNIDFTTIANGPVTSLATYSDITPKKGWFLGLLLFSLYPYVGSVSTSNINNDMLAIAMNSYCFKTATDNYMLQNYETAYSGMLIGSLVFAKLMGETNFRDRYRAFKQTNYTSAFVKTFRLTPSDTGEGYIGNTECPHGELFFPYAPVLHCSLGDGSNLMDRDLNAYTTGKTLRSTSVGTQAQNDEDLSWDTVLDSYDDATGLSWYTMHRDFMHTNFWAGDKVVTLIKQYTSKYPKRYRPWYYKTNTCNETDNVDSDTQATRDSNSYPSGHTGIGWCYAMTYASVDDLSDTEFNNLFKRAYQYGQARVVVGAHWQYCVDLGRIAGSCSYAYLCANNAFMDAVDEERYGHS